jgi:hypothetical protein
MANAGEEFVRNFIDALQARGIGARDIAATVAGRVGGELPPATENMPGFEYLNRVGSAGVMALSGQAKVLNNVWSEMRKGRYGLATALRTWAGMVDSYLSVLKEASRLPGTVQAPTWVLFQFEPLEKNAQQQLVRVDRRLIANTQFDHTPFVALDGAQPAADVYFDARLEGPGILIELDREKVSKMNPGVYMSFIFVKGQGPQTPLVNLVLQVKTP